MAGLHWMADPHGMTESDRSEAALSPVAFSANARQT